MPTDEFGENWDYTSREELARIVARASETLSAAVAGKGKDADPAAGIRGDAGLRYEAPKQAEWLPVGQAWVNPDLRAYVEAAEEAPAPALTAYRVVYGYGYDDLVAKVNKALAERWRPLGGLCADGEDFYQAMVR